MDMKIRKTTKIMIVFVLVLAVGYAVAWYVSDRIGASAFEKAKEAGHSLVDEEDVINVFNYSYDEDVYVEESDSVSVVVDGDTVSVRAE